MTRVEVRLGTASASPPVDCAGCHRRLDEGEKMVILSVADPAPMGRFRTRNRFVCGNCAGAVYSDRVPGTTTTIWVGDKKDRTPRGAGE